MLQLTIIRRPLALDTGQRDDRQSLAPLKQDLLRVVDTARDVVYVIELYATRELVPWRRHVTGRHVAIAKEDEFSCVAAAADPGGSSGV